MPVVVAAMSVVFDVNPEVCNENEYDEDLGCKTDEILGECLEPSVMKINTTCYNYGSIGNWMEHSNQDPKKALNFTPEQRAAVFSRLGRSDTRLALQRQPARSIEETLFRMLETDVPVGNLEEFRQLVQSVTERRTLRILLTMAAHYNHLIPLKYLHSKLQNQRDLFDALVYSLDYNRFDLIAKMTGFLWKHDLFDLVHHVTVFRSTRLLAVVLSRLSPARKNEIRVQFEGGRHLPDGGTVLSAITNEAPSGEDHVRFVNIIADMQMPVEVEYDVETDTVIDIKLRYAAALNMNLPRSMVFEKQEASGGVTRLTGTDDLVVFFGVRPGDTIVARWDV